MKRNIIATAILTAGVALAADAPIEIHHGVVTLQSLRQENRGATTTVGKGVAEILPRRRPRQQHDAGDHPV